VKVHRFSFVMIIAAVFLLTDTGGTPRGVVAQNVQGTPSASCSEFLDSVIAATNKACGQAGRNTACYGHTSIQAQAQANVSDFSFDTPGQIASLASIRTLQLSALDSSASTWGIAVLKVQANLPDTAPGQNVTMALFGDVHIQDALPTLTTTTVGEASVRKSPAKTAPVVGKLNANTSVLVNGRLKDKSWLHIQFSPAGGTSVKGWLPADAVTNVTADEISALAETDAAGVFYGAMGAFYFRSGIGANSCKDAPANGILIQSPRQPIHVTLSINGVNVTLGSTIELDAPQGGPMTLRTLEGSATAQVRNVQQIVPAGQQVEIPLDANQAASGPPGKPHAYNPADLRAIPDSLMPSPINIRVTGFTAKFVEADRTTYYEVTANAINGDPLSYKWSNTNHCGKFDSASTINRTSWLHSDDAGCPHNLTPDGGHDGTIGVEITDTHGEIAVVSYGDGSRSSRPTSPLKIEHQRAS